MQGSVVPALLDLKETYAIKRRTLGTQQLVLQEQIDSLCEKITEKKEENKETEGRVRMQQSYPIDAFTWVSKDTDFVFKRC